MAVTYKLDVQDGPRAGEKIALTKDGPLLIGRTKQGIDLLDPRVSTRHAQITWDVDRFWISDLGSATGTLVDGIAIGLEPVPMSPGTRVLIGDSTMVLSESRSILPQWVYWVALVVLALCTVPFINIIYDFSLPWHIKVPHATSDNPVNGPRGPVDPGGNARRVPLDRCFMQETFSDDRNTRIRRVTDFNQDGVDEIWIEGRNWERVYTFASDNSWELLGVLPRGCQNAPSASFPTLTCGVETWDWVPGVPYEAAEGECAKGSNLGQYKLRRMRGATVWIPEPGFGNQKGVPTPVQMGVKGTTSRDRNNILATWLSFRGVDEGVHYIVCEEMFPGMGAQVLTASGRIERLQPGCSTTVELSGTMRGIKYGTRRPVAVAFTDTGRKDLIDKFNVYLGGSELLHFQNGVQKSWSTALSQTPTLDTATLLEFEPQGPVRNFPPIAKENPRIRRGTSLERLGGLGVPGMRRAANWKWTKASSVLLTPCGEAVRVVTHGWRCGPPCVRNSTPFMTISQLPGPTWEISYAQGFDQHLYGRGIEIEVDVMSGSGNVVSQVVAASVGVRDTKVCSNSGELEDIPVKPDAGAAEFEE